jgi:hypothetical protein
MSDMPKEPPKQPEVGHENTSPEVSKFLDEWIKPKQPAAGRPSDNVSIGQVHEMKIPSGWMEGQSVKPVGGSSLFREFHPSEDPEVKLCFFYRGRRVSDQSAKAFHSALEQPAHTLKANELESLREVLREKGNPQQFNITAARTEDLNGKRVLVVEGKYLNTELESRALFVDSDGSGSAVQEIYYQAPRAQYAQNLQAAIDAMKSIRWK